MKPPNRLYNLRDGLLTNINGDESFWCSLYCGSNHKAEEYAFWQMVPNSCHNKNIMSETFTSENTDFVLYSNQGSDFPLDNLNLAVSTQHNNLLISSVAILGILLSQHFKPFLTTSTCNWLSALHPAYWRENYSCWGRKLPSFLLGCLARQCCVYICY